MENFQVFSSQKGMKQCKFSGCWIWRCCSNNLQWHASSRSTFNVRSTRHIWICILIYSTLIYVRLRIKKCIKFFASLLFISDLWVLGMTFFFRWRTWTGIIFVGNIILWKWQWLGSWRIWILLPNLLNIYFILNHSFIPVFPRVELFGKMIYFHYLFPRILYCTCYSSKWEKAKSEQLTIW